MNSAGYPSSLPPQRTMLPGGLRLGFVSLPAGSQAAALVRVQAGAHDAPGQYPGLAHFLEHLLFLGSEAYPPTRSLMPFVQGCAGQLNASTRERHTDYFFQVPAEAFGEALKRLLDMLARPLLDPAAQLREREVLQAEFLARGRDRDTLCDAAVGTALSSAHPFSGFHAGNRETLPVEDPLFQQALQDYHRRFYHSGQIELLVAAPCSLESLRVLLDCAECRLPVAPPVPRPVVPLRADSGASLRLKVSGARPCLDLAFALDAMPDEVCLALDVLGVWLASQAPDSLLAALRQAGWCEAAALRVPYWHDRQGVVIFQLQLTEQGMAARGQVVAVLRDWLRFMTSQAAWSQVWDEYVQIRERGLLGKEPLARLRYWIDPAAWRPSTDSAGVQLAFKTLGIRLGSLRPIILTVGSDQPTGDEPIVAATSGFVLELAKEPLSEAANRTRSWRLPAHNRWLSERLAPCVAPVRLPALHWLDHEGSTDQQAVLYLRWRFAANLPLAGLWHTLQAALRPFTLAAAQAGVELRFDDYGRSWCLALIGYAEALPLVLRDLLEVLQAPPVDAFAEGNRLHGAGRTPSADEILIRQLMRRVPMLLEPGTEECRVPMDQAGLTEAWRRSQWEALAIGLPSGSSGPLQAVLRALPGIPQASDEAEAGEAAPRYLWSRFGTPAEESALVLFCPLPARSVAVEAAWRQLARLMEGAFFRRLRSELQLGYAVFSGFRQFGEHMGIVFAVQSPSASAGEILLHIEAFLEAFAGSLDTRIAAAAGDDSTQAPGSDLRRRAERIWQARLAGFGPEHPAAVARAMAALRADRLAEQMQALRTAVGGWRVVANGDAPDARWQQR
ncbi:pyrroloquinoline quinone biosynthesis protein PqqF [Pseudomonas stutzeri]|uniref:pyrroloquinoline quinone biosynthesis protein PqqF n=1 Tax=Stutzerimonas stutzeri TaxID=316 RepID=UPI00190DBBDE|nr:pyrroloquinoline quinone biosynthesis protein PqqF [Stutzerimonas stutzeri]MBK3867483.1 pyrroloquinoline quinone biosynthesis protein PqqF [Stutzerimonas stutzeri]